LNAAFAMAILDKDDYERAEHGDEGNEHGPSFRLPFYRMWKDWENKEKFVANVADLPPNIPTTNLRTKFRNAEHYTITMDRIYEGNSIIKLQIQVAN
jgi:hypothetical protein